VADPESAVREAVEHAELAMDLDVLDSNVLGLVGCALSDIGHTTRAMPILKQAIEINSNNSQAHAALGSAYLHGEQWDRAIEHLRTGIELSPSDGRLAVWYSMLANAYMQSGAIDKACEAAQRGCQSDRKTYLPRVVLTAVYLLQGDTQQALAALDDCLRVKPDLTREEVELLVGRKLGIAIRKLRRQRDAQATQ
jgi:tetratricopeptide (TPR) repeat protein